MILTVTLLVCALNGTAAAGGDPQKDTSCQALQVPTADPEFTLGMCIGASGMHLASSYEATHPGEKVLRIQCSLGDGRPRPEKAA